MDIYLTNSSLKKIDFNILFIQPYHVGVMNLKRAFCKNYFINANHSISPPSLKSRVKHFAVGIALIIPIINTVAIALLRKADLKKIELNKKAATNIQCAFRQFKAKKIKEAKLKAKKAKEAELKAQEEAKRNEAAKKIQNAFRKYKEKKEYKVRKAKKAAAELKAKEEEKRNDAAKKIQAAFHKWKAKKAAKPRKTWALWQKGKKLFVNPYIQAMIEKQTKVNVGLATQSFVNLSEAARALSKQQFTLSAYYASLAMMGGFNATFKLFLPPGTSEMDKAYKYALADV